MKRGDVVTVSTSGDYGKPRPAVVVQTDALPASYSSAIICPVTSTIIDLSFRNAIEPTKDNGLRVPSQVMADKIITVPRTKIGTRIGTLDRKDMQRLNEALAFLLALTETTNP